MQWEKLSRLGRKSRRGLGPRRPPVGSRGRAPGGGRGGEAPQSCDCFCF
jgi:hypothetical protein